MFDSDFVYHFSSDVELRLDETSDRLLLQRKDTAIELSRGVDWLTHALVRMKDGLTKQHRLALLEVVDFDLAVFEYTILKLQESDLIEFSLIGESGQLLVVNPDRIDFLAPHTPESSSYTLSRFAFLRRIDNRLVLNSPETACTVVLTSPISIAAVCSLVDIHNQDSPNPSKDCQLVIQYIYRLGFLEPCNQPESTYRAYWEFHDLVFHSMSRPGDITRPYGGSYRFANSLPSPPAIRSRYPGDRIDLIRPDHSFIASKSNDVFSVLESRRSRRRMGSPAISLSQLSEFLYRVARVICVIPSPLQDLIKRVVPSGGAIHEIEFYISVHQCVGLSPGFYHYHGLDHAIYRLASSDMHADAIIRRAAADWGMGQSTPQVVITLATRHSRISWKYDTGAYRATLLNAGVVVQTMYLVCTDMGLACTPAGRGCPRIFADATGNDPFEETSILEVGIGTRDDTEVPLIDVRTQHGANDGGAGLVENSAFEL